MSKNYFPPFVPTFNIPAPNFSLPEAESAPTKFQVGDRVKPNDYCTFTNLRGRIGTVARAGSNCSLSVQLDGDSGEVFLYSDEVDLIERSAIALKVGDKVRTRLGCAWVDPGLELVIFKTGCRQEFGGVDGVHDVFVGYGHNDEGSFHLRSCDLELVPADNHEDAHASWRGVPFGRPDYTRALKIDHGASHSFAPKQRIRIKRSDKMEAFHGVEGAVVSVDPDGTYHCQLDGDSYTRETYRFRENELEAVKVKEAPKPRNQLPREPSLKSWSQDDGCNNIEPSSRRKGVRDLARELFASNPAVLSLVERVGDFSVRSIESRNIHIISDARLQNAIRTAWNRNEDGLRAACVEQAMRIVDERGGK